MKTFISREAPFYIEVIKEKLTLANIKENAIAVSGQPREVNNRKFTHCARIDFIGIAATTLFDAGKVVSKNTVFEEFSELLSNVQKLNDEGYFLKVRILLEYPHAVSAYTRIQAEYSQQRASIKTTGFLRDLRLTEQVDERIFAGSSYVNVQRQILRNIQYLFNEINKTGKWNDSQKTLNSFVIRFTPVQPGMCCLFINNTAFFDVYLLAKENTFEDKCRPFCPVIQLDKDDTSENTNLAFLAFEDHFRYLWDLDVTMDCEDATEYQVDVKDSLSKIRQPHLIKFDVKGERLFNKIAERKEGAIKKNDLAIWQSGINRIMNRLCADLSPSPALETIFITCSWVYGGGRFQPNKQARELYNYLQRDFDPKESPIASIHILEAAVADVLDKVLYRTMEDSTIGIVILTKDICSKELDESRQEFPEKYYSKPNVYHELGYMMKHLPSDRIIILAEKGVEIHSNIQHITRVDFQTDKICLKYLDIIMHLKKITNLDVADLEKIIVAFENRLTGKVDNNSITAKEKNSALEKNGKNEGKKS